MNILYWEIIVPMRKTAGYMELLKKKKSKVR